MLSALLTRPVAFAASLLRPVRRDQRGFTLVETLVAMVTGIIVTGALFAILEVSVRQSSHLSDVAQATQVSRGAMTRIVDELHSACLSSGFTPVIEKSTPTTLIFVNGYDEKKESKEAEPAAELPASAIHRDKIEFNEAAGTLTDTTWKATSNVPNGTAEKYPWSTTSTTVKLAEKVSQAEENGAKQPIFKYYAYATSSNSETGKAASTLEEKASLTSGTPLTEALANTVASVVVSFRTAPYTKESRLSSTVEKGTFADLSTQTTFAFSAPNSETTIQASPCE